ncbi:hypothetical protein K5X77_07205 [Vagococcus lutrae]|uniref:hypothetical protein n=1 Tax=Vagococcus lutrae TaxID=81947 RepID=UPI001C9715D9|nr:hypothetical protein [Vagococcus lutrae]QZN88251.1 hypothetical protein K5X77_07205 [Vagococcus lutrae]
MEDKLKKNSCEIFEYYENRTFWKEYISQLFKLFKNFTTKRLLAIVLVFIIIIPYILFLLPSDKIVKYWKEILDFINDLSLAMFGIIFTGYTFFQALLNKSTAKILIVEEDEEKIKKNNKNEEKEKSMPSSFYHVFSTSFYMLTIHSLFFFILSFFLKIIFIGIDDTFYIACFTPLTNEIIAGIGISVYISLFLILLLETKSMVFNLSNLFALHTVNKVLSNDD